MVIISNFTPPEAGVLHHEPACQLLIDENQLGTGDLYVTESAVVWANSQSSQCITLMYRQISLHAVQRVPVPLIYMMLDYKFRLPGQPEPVSADSDDDYDPDEAPSTELKFIPQNEESLPSIYTALNTGQCLHPDEEHEGGEAMLGDDLAPDFMVADLATEQSNDAASRMEELSIEHSNSNGHAANDDEDEQFADA